MVSDCERFYFAAFQRLVDGLSTEPVSALNKVSSEKGAKDRAFKRSDLLVFKSYLLDRLNVDGGKHYHDRLTLMRQQAIQACVFFERFSPQVFGAAVSGLVFKESILDLILISEDVESVIFYLQDNTVPFDQDEQRYDNRGRVVKIPVLGFVAGNIPVRVWVCRMTERDYIRDAFSGKVEDRMSLEMIKQRWPQKH